MQTAEPLNVLIVGAGSAAFEAAFRLQRVARDNVAVTMLAPDHKFLTRSMMTRAPFAASIIPKPPVADLAAAAGAELLHGRMSAVEPEAHIVLTEENEEIAYDVLLVAIGGTQRAPYEHGLVFGAPGSEDRMLGLVQDLESGYIGRLAFVVPAAVTWPVPLYELALMSAERAYDQCVHCTVTVITNEAAPLEMFGSVASQTLSLELDRLGIGLHTNTDARVRDPRTVEINSNGDRLKVDRVITIPIIDGPAVPGLPHDERGFLPVDPDGHVNGVPDVFAAGDVTDHPIKQGGLACQQADAAAESIAARAGVAIDPRPFTENLEGVLLSGRKPTFLCSHEDASRESAHLTDWRSIKLGGEELARQLEVAQ